MKGWITINTDAGLYPIDGIGSYAYWIKGTGLMLSGSGLLKGKIKSSTVAESMAIANALHVLKKSKHEPIVKIIINRDNIYARSRKRGSEVEKLIYKYLKELFNESHKKHEGYKFTSFFEFRHVRAHQKEISDARSWVNNWLDAKCREELRKWADENKKKKATA